MTDVSMEFIDSARCMISKMQNSRLATLSRLHSHSINAQLSPLSSDANPWSECAFLSSGRLVPRGESGGATRQLSVRERTLFSRRGPGENWSSHGCCTSFWLRHLAGLAQAWLTPQNSANGWIRNVVKVIGVPLADYNHVIVMKTLITVDSLRAQK